LLLQAIKDHNRPGFIVRGSSAEGWDADDAAVARRRKKEAKRERDTAAPESTVPTVKKTPGVANATRKVLEWLQTGSLTLQEIAQRLPKLSKAKVQTVLDTLRMTGLVRLIRRQYTDSAGAAKEEEYYQMSDGQTQPVPVSIGTISKDLRARSEEIHAMENRIAALEHELRRPVNELQPAEAIQMLKSFMRVDKSLEDEPFYAVVKAAIGS
jgi:DNA-binding transcriptional ArsR family regulator